MAIRVGSIVKVKSKEEIKRYLENEKYRYSHTINFVSDMFEECDKKFRVQGIIHPSNDEDFVGYRLGGFKEKYDSGWSWCGWMLDVIEELKVCDEKSREEMMSKKNKEEIDWASIKEEMKSKIDTQKIKKILAGSYDLRLKDMQGVDSLLEDWAEAKKYIYLDLGRNISIAKKSEVKITRDNMSAVFRSLYEKFPKYIFLLSYLNDDEIFDNEYHGNSLNTLHKYFPEIKRRNETFSIVEYGASR